MEKITVTADLRRVFSNRLIESGLTVAEILTYSPKRFPPQTFAKHLVKLPKEISADEFLLVARMSQANLHDDAPNLIRLVREGPNDLNDPTYLALCAQTVPTSTKEEQRLQKWALELATSSKRILVFDRANKLQFFSPWTNFIEGSKLNLDDKCWLKPPNRLLRYKRTPRIFGCLTRESLRKRILVTGDEGMEKLIEGIEFGEFSASIIDDSPLIAHRVFQGVFHDAAAVTIFDNRAMVVFPNHEQAWRVYDANQDRSHVRIIRDAIRVFRRMRRFRMHGPLATSTVDFLKQYLTYGQDDIAA